MLKINFEMSACFLSLLCLIYILTAKRKQYRLRSGIDKTLMNQHFVFLMMLISSIVSSAASVGGVYLQMIASPKVASLQYLLHSVYYISHNALPVAFALYVMLVTGSAGKRKRLFYYIFCIPFFVAELLVITNGFTGFVFYMDGDLQYHRGSLISLVYACGIIYFVLGFAFFFQHKKAISRDDSYTIGVLLSLTAIGVAVQALKSSFAIELYMQSLTLVGLMMMLEERSGHVDPVTGALNRVALIDDTRRLIETKQSFKIVLVKLTDIDLFSKLFNGREMDSLLMQVSEYLTFIGSEQSTYNYRSCDFALIYTGKTDSQVESVANTILKRFASDWKSGGASFHLEVALSILKVPEDIDTVDGLMDVLTSGYSKSGSIGSRIVSYDEIYANRRNREIEEALREAVNSNLLRLYYQPIWSVDEKRTVAAEALLRIDSEVFRKLSPAVYIPIAEQCGIIREIGLFVFEDVCRFLKMTKKKGIKIEYIELNLSVHQFIYDDLVDRFEAIRRKYDIPADAINLEITESASIEDTPIIESSMESLRKLGYTFSLDDFGTGYSTVMQFIKSSYKNVKIDKSLLWESDTNEMSAKLLDSLIHVIRSLGCNVVQEGVENEQQLERTANSGGNLIQGYYFSKPISESDFVEYLKKENSPVTA